MPRNANSPSRLRSGEGNHRRRSASFSTARSRFRAIIPLLRFRTRQLEGRQPVSLLPSGREIATLNQYVECRAAQLGISAGTLWRWIRLFRTAGLKGLRDAPRRDKGISKFFSTRPDAITLVVIWSVEGRSIPGIRQRLAEVWPDLYPNSRPPSCPTIRAFIKSLNLSRKVES